MRQSTEHKSAELYVVVSVRDTQPFGRDEGTQHAPLVQHPQAPISAVFGAVTDFENYPLLETRPPNS